MCHFFGQQKSKKIASLTMSLPVKYVLSVLIRALRRARHFALVEDVPIQPRLARNPFQVRNSVRPMHLFGHNSDHDYYFELPP